MPSYAKFVRILILSILIFIVNEGVAVCSTLAAARSGAGTVPTFVAPSFGHRPVRSGGIVLMGRDPRTPGITTVNVELVPVTLQFNNKKYVLNATRYAKDVERSPIFAPAFFGSGGRRQFIDALLGASIPGGKAGHTRLAVIGVRPVTVAVPGSRGYVLTDDDGAKVMGVVDEQYLQRRVINAIGPVRDTLIMAFALNTTYFAAGDATICCSWGTHGTDPETGDSFVLSTYLHDAPSIVKDKDIQPLTSEVAEFTYNPLFNPSDYLHNKPTGNVFDAWQVPGAPAGRCAGTGPGSNYFFLNPTVLSHKNQFPHSSASLTTTRYGGYHVANVALLGWYLHAPKSVRGWSFPDATALTVAPQACAAGRFRPTAVAHPSRASVRDGGGGAYVAKSSAHHWLIGYYWLDPKGSGAQLSNLMRLAGPWNVVIIAFAAPVPSGVEGDMQLKVPVNWRPAELARVIRELRAKGKKVLLSLGGGAEYFKFGHRADIPRFVSSVSAIVKEYGFNGIDLDFETPSLELQPGDTDFRSPKTSSIVNLIIALKYLKSEFGPDFMISIVPEGPQVNAGAVTYGGQFGSELPLIYALRGMLSFVDVQEYNTPPLEGLDGKIYQSHTVDYIASMTELLLHGFDVDRNPRMHFPSLPENKVAVGFLVNYDEPILSAKSFRYLESGTRVSGIHYDLQSSAAYPSLLGVMFWNMESDAARGKEYSDAASAALLNDTTNGTSAGGTSHRWP